MMRGVGGEVYRCTIAGHRRTRIFEFPQISLHMNEGNRHHFIYGAPPTHACVTADLIDYFESGVTRSDHYALSRPLRHETRRAVEEQKSQNRDGKIPVFLVIEEQHALVPVPMVKGECNIMDEVMVKEDGRTVPMLKGGREGKRYISASYSVEGAWPEVPRNRKLVNLILAAVRVGQQTSDPIRKYIDHSCFVTDDDQYVVKVPRAKASARLTTSMPMDADAFEGKAAEIRHAIRAMEPDVVEPHMELLVRAMYIDEHKGEAEKLLEFLRLWQSVEENVKKLSSGNVDWDKKVAGKWTLQELKEYRHDIAHWWTETIDENYLSNLRSTVNELMRRKYF